MGVSGAGGSGLCLSVIELGGVGPLLLILLVVLHPLQPLPGEVLEHDVVVTGGEGTNTHTHTHRERFCGVRGAQRVGLGREGGPEALLLALGCEALLLRTPTRPHWEEGCEWERPQSSRGSSKATPKPVSAPGYARRAPTAAPKRPKATPNLSDPPRAAPKAPKASKCSPKIYSSPKSSPRPPPAAPKPPHNLILLHQDLILQPQILPQTTPLHQSSPKSPPVSPPPPPPGSPIAAQARRWAFTPMVQHRHPRDTTGTAWGQRRDAPRHGDGCFLTVLLLSCKSHAGGRGGWGGGREQREERRALGSACGAGTAPPARVRGWGQHAAVPSSKGGMCTPTRTPRRRGGLLLCVKLYQVCIYGSFVLWN